MKSKYLFIMFTMLFCMTTHAEVTPRVFSIIFADTNDDKIGIGAQVSHDNYLSLFTTIATAVESTNSPDAISKTGYECNKSNLISVLNNLQITPNDIVIFVYAGHGARGLKDWSNFPQICFAKPEGKKYRNPEEFYPLENVRNIIMQKNPRFCLVIGDCCNSESPSLSTKEKIEPAFMGIQDIPTNDGMKVIRNLIMNKYGSVMLTASIKGEYGWCYNSTNPQYSGMFLEHNFNYILQKVKDNKKSYTNWEELLKDTRSATYNYSKEAIIVKDGITYTQTPYYEISLSDTRNIDKKDSIRPNPPISSLRNDLVKIGDDQNLTGKERINLSKQILEKYFDKDNALVDVVGLDNQTIILSTTIRSYLLKLATEQKLANLTILREEKDAQGNVFYLKIHELYRE